MNPQEKLVKLMQWKNKMINKEMKEIWLKYPKGTKPYFIKEDKEDLLRWSNEKAEYVLSEISVNVNERYSLSLGYKNCPYCILYFYHNCWGCNYGRNHGECKMTESSTYYFLQKNLLFTYLTNQAYKDFFKKINKCTSATKPN